MLVHLTYTERKENTGSNEVILITGLDLKMRFNVSRKVDMILNVSVKAKVLSNT